MSTSGSPLHIPSPGCGHHLSGWPWNGKRQLGHCTQCSFWRMTEPGGRRGRERRIFIHLFGCLVSQLWHTGSLVVALRLSSSSTWPCMWNLSSPTSDRTHVPLIGRWMLNHQTRKEVPGMDFVHCRYRYVGHLPGGPPGIHWGHMGLLTPLLLVSRPH